MRSKLWLILCLFGWLVQAAWAQTDPTLDTFIQEALGRYQVPGTSVAVVKDGKIVHLKGYGVRHLGASAPVGPDTVFQLASVTKSFTAILGAQAVEQGRLTWDGPVAEVLSDLRLQGDFPTLTVSLRDLLVHRSGLPAYSGDLFDVLGYSRAEVLRRIQWMPLSVGFRNRPAYTNVGFFLAGMAEERAFGQSWEAAMSERVLEPLKLTRTGYFGDTIRADQDIAWPHLPSKGKLVAMDHFDMQRVLGPAGLMTSTAADMARVALMLLSDGSLEGTRILNAESVQQLFTPCIYAEPEFAEFPPIGTATGFAYSPGFAVYYYNGHRVVEKVGARAGMRSVITLVPDLKLGVVALSNRNLTSLPEAIRARVLEQYAGPAGSDLQAAIWAKQTEIDKMFAAISLDPVAPPSPRSKCPVPLSALAGTYENELYGKVNIQVSADHLTWSMGPAHYGGNLFLMGQTTFLMTEPPGRVSIPSEATFVVNADGKPVELQTEDLGKFRRVPATR